jgi:hypothetical protein
MTLSRGIAVATATAALAAGGSAPALAMSMMKHWTKSECASYVKKYDKAMGMKKTDANKTLKEHGCSKKVG